MKKTPAVRLLSRLIASPCLLAILASLPAQAETRIQHTPENSATMVTDILNQSYDTVKLKAKAAQPLGKYFIGGMNLGSISAYALHSWDAGQKTAWTPTGYSTGNFQTAQTDTASEVSAMQAQNFNFGGYLRNTEVPLDGWRQPNIRYAYRFPTALYPFKYGTNGTNGDSTKVVVSFYASVPQYNDYGLAVGSRGIGFGGGGIGFIDRSTTPWKMLVYGFGYFDKRGYNVSGGHHEEVAPGDGLFMVKCIFEKNTIYSSLMPESALYPNTPASAVSQTTTWTPLKRFAISISRNQFTRAVKKVNDYIRSHPEAGFLSYSENPDSYTVGSFDVGIEAAVDNHIGGTYPFTMSFKGSHLTLSTIY